jgi:hypothetical protein
MIRSLFSRPSQAPVRGVHLYLSADHFIVAALHQNSDGIYFEQPGSLLTTGQPTPAELGAAFQRALGSFSLQDKDLRDAKRGDWPAFRASGLRSVKEFESAFRPMQCYSLDASNAVVRAVMQHPAYEGVELSVSLNPRLLPEAVGEKLLQLARAANAV